MRHGAVALSRESNSSAVGSVRRLSAVCCTAFSRAWSRAERWAMLSSWLRHVRMVPSGRRRTRLTVSLSG